MVLAPPVPLNCPRWEIATWIWGPPDAGKTQYVLDHHPGYYEKEISKYWNGYQGEEIILIDDIEKDGHQFMKPFLKRWIQ